jgi:hypothetical protein
MSQRTSSSQTTSGPITFTLKPRNRGIRLSATHVTATADETQHVLCQRIARIANLKPTRLRVTLETNGRVIDARTHRDNPPMVRDLEGEEPVLLIKDLGIAPLLRINH